MLLFLFIFLGLLISTSALSASSETALFSLSSMHVQAFRKSPEKGKRLAAELLSSPRDLLITLIMINVIVNILIQNVVSSIFDEFSGWWLHVGVPLALTLVFGEFIPKSVGIANNEMIAPKVSPFISFMKKVFLPIRIVLIRITSFISRFMFFYLKDEKEISTDELQHTLRTSSTKGILAQDEAELMRGYLNLQEASAKELQRPREEILYYELKEPLSKLIHLFVDQECTRIPVCDNGLDNIIGIMSSGRFFLLRESIHQSKDVIPILKKPLFVPESISAQILLDQMYEKQESIAIVVDEYGATSGLITLEDLVEAVVGEILDRRDEKSKYTRSGNDVIIGSGRLELMELEAIFDVSIESKHHMVTVGGWLTEQLGEIPKSGTKFTYKNLLFHVLSADAKKVFRVYIRRIQK